MENKVKVFLIAMILFITGGFVPKGLATETATSDEFAEFENTYESEAPTVDVAELSSTFTSEKEIEVYLRTTRSDIERIVISGWSGGAYSKYLTSKTATYDELREIYTVTFNLDEIVNTNTNQVENADTITYSFDACVYGENGSMSYYNLDNVEYTATGFTYTAQTSGDTTTVTLNAVESGEVAILKEGEEIIEDTVWQPAEAGENTYSISTLSLDESTEDYGTPVETYQIMYRSASTLAVTSAEIEVLSSEPVENVSTYQNDETFEFEISENGDILGWISYEDTPEIFESTIQGRSGDTATATIKINTQYSGILSFDYMVSSESEFDTFTFDITGATPVYTDDESSEEKFTKKTISGQQDWTSYVREFKAPSSGVITIKLTYEKDKNVNRYEDKAAIRNLKFTPILPTNGEVIIDYGAEYTSDTKLYLIINVDDAKFMYISESETKPLVNAAGWIALQETYEYTLQNTENGEKTIYVWFKDENDAMSIEAATATIKLDNSEPTTDAPSVESTATTIKITLSQTDENPFKSVGYGYRVAGTSGEFIWIENIKEYKYTITGLTEKTEYEIKTKVLDGVHEAVESEITNVKTKIVSDGIAITKTPAIKTLEEVDVTIIWNNDVYTKRYSIDNETWIDVTAEAQTTIHMSENGIIYYEMTDGTYTTGILEYAVDNIDRSGPRVKSIGVVTPATGKYGIGDEITIVLEWDEEVIIGEEPVLNIKFDDGAIIPLTKVESDETTITYKYAIVPQDSGYLIIDSISGGLVYDALNNEAVYELPAQTGSTIYAENSAYIASKDTYYATLQNAINAAGTEPTTIKIVANTALRDTATIREGQNIIIDLNGKTISLENNNAIVTAIENNGTLKIIDTAENKGTIKAVSQTKSAYTIINNNTGKIVVETGTIEAISNSSSVALESYGIYNKESGEITLGIDDAEVSQILPEIKATSRTSVGVKLVGDGGRLNYYDGIIKGTETAIQAVEGATAYTIPTGYMDKIEVREENEVEYLVSYLSNEMVAELTMDGKTTSYFSLIDALEKVPADGREATIKILADETLKEIAKIYKGQNITIDLNGYTITRTEELNNAVYTILNNGTLVLKDTTEEKKGTVQAISNSNVITYAVYNAENGDLTIDGVTLFAKRTSSSNTNSYYGLYNVSTNNTKFYDGKIYLKSTVSYINPTKVETLENKYIRQDKETIDGVNYKFNYISDMPAVTLTVSGETSGHSSIQNAINTLTNDTEAIIRMEDNEELVSYINIPENRNVILDLNGKKITASALSYGIYTKASNFEVKDTSIDNEGVITVSASSSCYAIYNAGTGIVNIKNINVSSYCGAYNALGGIVNIAESTITGSTYGVYNSGIGTVNVTESTINGSNYGTYNAGNGIVNITNSTISIRGVYNSSGIINITDSTVSSSSYGVYNRNNSGTINITNSIISSSSSYGVHNYNNGIVNIVDSTITSTSNYGIYNEGNGTIIVSGDASVITGSSYGIYVKGSTSKIIMEGGSLKGKTNGIYIPEAMRIKNSGDSEAGYINIPEATHLGLKVEDSYKVIYIEYENLLVELERPDATKDKYPSIQDAIDNILEDGGYKIKLLYGMYIDESVEIPSNIELQLDFNGKNLSSNRSKMISNAGNLTICNTSNSEDSAILGSSYGIYNNESGDIIVIGMNIITSTYGVYNNSNGTVSIENSTITTSSTYGVYNNLSGAINIRNSTIKASSSGVYNATNGTVSIENSTITTTSTSSSGVYNAANGTVNIEESTIKTSHTGIYNKADGEITVIGGTITASSSTYGCGINNAGNGIINFIDGSIKASSSTTSSYNNNFVYGINNAQGGIINVSGGTITASTSTSAPTPSTNYTYCIAGINNAESGEINVTGGKISSTSRLADYGINNVKEGVIIITGGTIESSSYGIHSTAKGSITIGENDGNYDTSEPVIKGQYAIYLKAMGSEFYFNDGILMGTNSAVVYPSSIKFEHNETIQEEYYAINIPENVYIKDGKNGSYYTKVLVDEYSYKLTYVSNEENIEEYYTSLYSAMNNAPTGIETKITALTDMYESLGATVGSNKNIILDLNGKNITFEFSSGITGITNNGTLQIIDSAMQGGGTIKATSTSGTTYAIYQNTSNAKLTIGSGEGVLNVDYPNIIGKNYGIYKSNGTLTICDGKITGKDSIYGTVNSTAEYSLKTMTNVDGTETSFLMETGTITIIPESTKWTNESQNINIYYTDTINTNQYKIASGNWKSLSKGSTKIELDVSENAIIYAQTVDTAGNILASGEYEVSNIDKQAPIIENIAITNELGTKQTITVQCAEDEKNGSGLKGYIITMDSEKILEGAEWINNSEYIFTCDVNKNGIWYIYVIDNVGNISNAVSIVAENIDSEVPIVSNIEVISPESGSYIASTEITLNVNWSEEIIVTEAPVLKIRFGTGTIKEATYKNTEANISTYTYTIETDDYGLLTLQSFSEGIVKDAMGNEYAETEIELIGSKIEAARTSAYIESTNTYYKTLKEAIDSCSTEATEYTKITLVNDDSYSSTSITVRKGQKIEIDLNGENVTFTNVSTGIINNGDLIINDNSESGNGKINYPYGYGINNAGSGVVTLKGGKLASTSSSSYNGHIYGINNAGSGGVTVIDGTITAYGRYAYGINNVGNGDITITGGSIIATSSYSSSSSSYAYGIRNTESGIILVSGEETVIQGTTYGLYVSNENAKIILEGGEFKGQNTGIYIPTGMTIKNDGESEYGYVNLPEGKIIGAKVENNYVVNFLEDGTAVVELEKPDGTKEEYLSIHYAMEVVSGDGKYKIKMLNSEAITKSIEIAEGMNIDIELNGKGIYSKNVSKAIINNGDLIIKDSSETNNGKIVSSYTSNVYAIENAGKGNIEITGGTITTNTSSSRSKAYGVNNVGSGDIIITGGSIATSLSSTASSSYAYGINNSGNGNVEITEGTIRISSSSSSSYVYGINNIGNGKITIIAGTVEVTAQEYYSYAYGINNTEKGDIKITGGTITTTVSSYNSRAYGINNVSGNVEITGVSISVSSKHYQASYAYGINNSGMGNTEITGGNITITTSSSNSYGINNSGSGAVNVSDGTISVTSSLYSAYIYGINNAGSGKLNVIGGNVSARSSYTSNAFSNVDYRYVYGIYNSAKGELYLDGCKVASTAGKANSSIYYTYGLYILNNQNAKIIIEGGEYKGQTEGIYLPSGMKIKNSGDYEIGYINILEGKHIGYRIENEYKVNFLEDGNAIAELERPDGTKELYLSIFDAIAEVSEDGKYKITMLQNEMLSRTFEISEEKEIEIDLNGHEIYSKGREKTVINSGKLTITDTSESGDGSITVRASDYTIYNTGNITINKGSVVAISSKYNIYNAESGLINFNGGTIRTTTGSSSYGIYNAGNGTINVNGGVIDSIKSTGTTGSSYAYGIFNAGSGNINVNNGIINSSAYYAYGIRNEGGGTVYLSSGEISISSATYSYGISNGGSGTINISGGTIEANDSSSAYGVYNSQTGPINISNGIIEANASSYAYGVYNSQTGPIYMSGGVINAYSPKYSSGHYWSYGAYFNNSSARFKFSGGKIMSNGYSIYPENKYVELELNTIIEKYTRVIDGITYKVAEVAEIGSVVVINNGDERYFSTLEYAMTEAQTYNTRTLVKLLKDVEYTSGITISSGKNIQLDLNGKTITASTTRAFTNNGILEITDSVGDGKLEVKYNGSEVYGVYNNSSSAKFKQTGGSIEVTSIGSNAYGVYNYNGTSTTTGSEAIRIEGGSISAKAEVGTNSAVSGTAYGIYNYYSGAVVVTGSDTDIVASSALSNSYGIYDHSNRTSALTLGNKDGLTNNASPYIVGGTYGIYKDDSSTFALYGGSVTGATGKSMNRAVTAKEANTTVYVVDNLDGTETSILLKNVMSVEGVPEELIFGNLEQSETFEASYLPVDASGVTITYDVSDWNIIDIREENNTFIIRPKETGNSVIKVIATDITGKEVFALCEVVVDLIPPTDTAPQATSTGSSITIKCMQEDANLDVSQTRYAISSDGGITWSTWTSRSTISGLEPDTEYMVKTRASDLGGNVTESQATTIRTKMPNQSTFILEPDTMTKENVKVTIIWNNSEGTPQYYKINNGEWILVEGKKTELTISEVNAMVYTKLIYDGAEDSDINSTIVDNIDRLIPTGTFTINEVKPRYDGLVTLNITTSDDATAIGDNAGLVSYIYITEENLETAPADDDANWIRYTGDTTAYPYAIQTESGDVTIYMWFMDKAHNVSAEVASGEITYIPPVAALVEDDVVIGEYNSIADAYNAARHNNGNVSHIIVCQDTTLDKTLTIGETKNIKLDLNGKTVTSALATGIANNGTLEIADSKGNGKYVNTYSSATSYAINNTQKLTISGGDIQMINSVSSSSYTIRTIYNNGSSAKLNITGGRVYAQMTRTSSSSADKYPAYAIYNNSSLTSETSVTITGGTVEAKGLNYAYAYGLYNANSGKSEIDGAEVIVNTVSGYGYGIYKSGSGTVSISDSEVSVKTTSNSAYGVYNNSSSEMNITKTNVNVTSTSSNAYGAYINSSGAINITNSNIAATSTSSYAYGIFKANSGVVTIASGNITGKSTNSTGYGIYNNATNAITIGKNDGLVENEAVVIEGSTYGIYRSSGTYYFYDGTIKGKTGQSIYCAIGYLRTPTNYGVVKTTSNSIETATLVYDDNAPTIESMEITTDIDVNKQTITVTGVSDIGTGIVGYLFSSSSTVPTQASTNWTSVTTTNGPEEYSFEVTSNGTYYFWAMDAAGNVSETVSITAENIKTKVTSATMSNITLEVGDEKTLTVNLNSGAEPKSMTFTSSNESVAYVNSTTGVVIGVSIGTATITCNILNYDGTLVTATCTATVTINPPAIIMQPSDRTVKEGTSVQYIVDATGRGLKYQWYEVADGTVTELTEDHNKIYKSNIEGEANTTATEKIIINTTASGELSFDYMVSSEENNDTFTVTIEDANGIITAVDSISGKVNWTTYTSEFTPNADGQIILTLTYSKNGNIDEGLDFGAIRNLNYYYFGGIEVEATFDAATDSEYLTYSTNNTYEWEKYTDSTGDIIFKSTNGSKDSTTSKSVITINTELSGTLSFDWMVSSETNYDKLTITLTDANNNNKILVDAKSGVIAWNGENIDVTPNQNNEVILTLSYVKDSSQSRNSDIGAIKNLKIDSEGYKTDYSTFVTDNLFTVSNTGFEVANYTGVNTPSLQIPGALVTEDMSGTKYYCVVTNSGGSATSREALLTIAEEEIPVEVQLTQTAPTLEVGYKQITATCNQIGGEITNTYYAISSDDVTYSAWQTSNVFTGLNEGTRYFVKTKVVAGDKEQESISSMAIVPVIVASLEESGDITYYDSVQDAVNAANDQKPTEKSIIKLLNTETRNTQVTVATGKNISLDLNGNDLIIVSSSSATLNGINNQATLEILDSKGEGEIKVSSSSTSTSYYAYGIYNNGGTLTVKSGSISATRPSSVKTYARAIYNTVSGTVTIGTNDGNVSTTKPSLESTGYGLYNTNGTINFYDGVIISNKDNSTYGTINPAPGYRIKEEDINSESKTYLEKLVIDEAKAMVMKWEIPANTKVYLPISSNTNVSIVVDWGDGSALQEYKSATYPSHTYTKAGTFTIKLSGTLSTFGYYTNTAPSNTNSNYTFTQYLKTVEKFGELGATRYGFAYCKNLESVTIDESQDSFKNVTNMAYMFNNCSSLENLDLGSLDTSKVTNMTSMFANATSLNSILVSEKFIVSTTCTDMFTNASSLTSIIVTSEEPTASQFTLASDKIGSQTIFYVPSKEAESLYEEAWKLDYTENKIEPMLELIGGERVKAGMDEGYKEEYYTVAGFDIEEAEKYSVYGYNVSISGDVDTSKLGENTLEYTLTRENSDGEILSETTVTRIVEVIESATEIFYEDGSKYDGEWTKQNVIVVRTKMSSKTQGLSVKLGSEDWTNAPTYAEIVSSGDQLIVILKETMNDAIYIKEIDAAGNDTMNSTNGSIIKIDKEKPIVEEVKSKTIDQKVYVKAKADDAESGVAYYAVTLTNSKPSKWEEITNESGEILHEVDGTGTYYLWVKDAVGNETEEANIVNVVRDVKPPVGSIDIQALNTSQSGDKYTNEGLVFVKINVTDNESEPEEIMYALYNEADYAEIKAGTKEIVWSKYAKTIETIPFELEEPDGVNIIYVIFKDLAGNITLH